MGSHKSISPHLIVFLIVCSFLLPACAFPTKPINPKLIERENACIALGSCPSAETPSPAPDESTSASSHPSSATTAPPQTDTTLPPGPTESVTVDTKPNPIKKGYVAFGDSFAAGFGTGTTTGDACRQGEFSYPKQLASSAPVGIDFQNLACSGAVITEILSGGTGSQIDMWTNPANADIATLSIGGNDVGFSKILDACIVQSMGGAGQLFYDCQARIQDATATMTGNDLYQTIFQALSQIVTKSGRTDFKIYFTVLRIGRVSVIGNSLYTSARWWRGGGCYE
jgi:lysophospholipase L1-like esterase